MTDPDETPTADPADNPSDRLEAILAQHREPAEGEDHEATAEEGAGTDPLADVLSPADPEEDAEPEDPLPQAPLFALLRTVEDEIGPDRIDRIWVFPPRRLKSGETAVVVVAAYPRVEEDRRRVYAAHYTAHEEAKEPRLALDEYGTAPTDRVGRLVEEVVERLKDEPAAAPNAHSIQGNASRWRAVLHELAEGFLTQTRRNPRLRP